MQNSSFLAVLSLQYNITFLFVSAIIVFIGYLFKNHKAFFKRHDTVTVSIIALIGFSCGVADSIHEIFWLHMPLIDSLPLELCGFTYAIFMPLALLTRNVLMQQIALYWGVMGAMLSFLFPNLSTTLDFEYFRYYIAHGTLLIGVIYPFLVRDVPLTRWTFLKGWFALQTFSIIMLSFDLIFHVNYFYLVHKPPETSPLDDMGPWPYYLVICESIAFVLYFIINLFGRTCLKNEKVI